MDDRIDEESWAPLIGRFVIAFGKIERCTHRCVREWSDPLMHEHVRRFPLHQRLKLVRDLVKRSGATHELQKEFIDCINFADKLRDQRNSIAHDSLGLIVNIDDQDLAFEPAITSEHRDAHISFDHLQAITVNAEECAERLNKIHAMIWIQNINPEDIKNLGGLQPPNRSPA